MTKSQDLLNIDAMLDDGLDPKTQQHILTLVGIDPNAIKPSQIDELRSRACYLSDEGKKLFGIDTKVSASKSGDDFSSKTVAQLRTLCKSKGVSTNGSKAELIERLSA